MPISHVLEELNTSLSTVRALEDKGIAIIFDKEVHRDPIKKTIPKYNKILLNNQQNKVFNRIIKSLNKEDEKK